MNIVIIGMRGAGKSNVSRRLSVLVKRPVFATDDMIVYENGRKSIDDIIADNNGDWFQFRDLEFDTVKKISQMDNVIVDCGGGVVVDLDKDGKEIYSKRKIKALKEKGTVVWLKGDMERLVEKVEKKANRPTLDSRTSTLALMKRRLPFYEKAADIVVDIEGKKRPELAEEIFKIFESQL